MGKVVVHNQVTVNGAFEAPTPEEWLELDADSGDAGLEQLILADALLLGRKTYEGLAAVWPHLAADPTMGHYAGRINDMPKYVASRTLSGPLEWNATLIEGEVTQAVPALKDKHTGNLIISGCGELAHTLAAQGQVDEFWFWMNPHLWPDGPRILDGVGPIRLQLVSATPYRSGVVWLRYRPAGA
ncbi:dihydrofolate reductase family protein [Asanoa sp. WMMD1127]|uniref:dihydrofolate reductase family protein n=1 Tax=Asanoa sp. WMMD1127 TaxID=3016107 RepID=UPI0024161596|nr:dihydrofolate reductase family protein [Asanoa sp. WMMD1127]MDG4824108.1 dihydrofolate reductase family protein [Asanoa sp. WMMD1127]